MMVPRAVVAEVDVVTPVVDGRRREKRLVVRARAKLPLVSPRASPQAVGVAEAALAGDQPNVVGSEEVQVVGGLV